MENNQHKHFGWFRSKLCDNGQKGRYMARLL